MDGGLAKVAAGVPKMAKINPIETSMAGRVS